MISASEWERMWSPYDEMTYTAVLQHIQPDDVVLDIGAGDLRLTRRIAMIAQHVYAWENQEGVWSDLAQPLPKNLTMQVVDARFTVAPAGVTTAVLLMRHCRHFALYAKTLRAAGCQRLITNARWGMGVEVIPLQLPRMLYRVAPMGWFACWCGQTGFKPGATNYLTMEMETAVHEVIDCPNCHNTQWTKH